MSENYSFVPLGLVCFPLSHGLRRGLNSYAALRLKLGFTASPKF